MKTIEQKAKAYDEAIERAREWYNNPNSSSIGKSYLYAVFPSLAESEDEGIRKTIIDFLKNIEEENESYLIFDNTTTTDMIAWLEKQCPKENNANEETNAPTEYGKYVDECLYEASKHFFSEGEDKYSVADLFYAGVRCGKSWFEKQGSEPNWCHHKVDLSNCSEEYRKAYYDGWNNCNQQHSQCESEKNDVLKCLINGMKFYYEDNEEATWGTEKFSMKVKDILSWLEKQGKQKSIDDLTQQEAMDIAVAKCFEQDEPQVYEIEDGKVITYSENGGYKVIEPKFKVGDWIVTDKNHIWLIDEDCSTIGYSYRLISQNGKVEVGDYNIVDEHARLWTIQNAKDGDVLARNNDMLSICIFSHFDGINDKFSSFLCHCGLEGEGLGQELSINGYHDDSKNYVPATKEQRDILFQKMHEAGYVWDDEKKERRLQTAEWGEEDDSIVENILFWLKSVLNKSCYPRYEHWFKSIKQRIVK